MKRLEAVIFDWAGTTVDHGSLAPVRAITELFAWQGIRLSDEDARRDMGIFKKDHIRRILSIPHVGAAWRESKLGQALSPANSSKVPERAVEMLFEKFQPLQMEILEAYSQLIDGTVDITERLRRQGLKVGSTTGYTRPMLDALLRCAAAQGYRPDAALCPDDTGGGRPHPWMCQRITLDFRLAAKARQKLQAAGAHYVIERVSLLEPVLEEIDARLVAGERP